jgi:uncharacterized protein YjiS (DUF1127 family)
MATTVITTRRADLLDGRAPSARSGRLGELFALVNGWVERRRQYRATLAELSALDDELLADIGVARSEIEPVARRVAGQAARWR